MLLIDEFSGSSDGKGRCQPWWFEAHLDTPNGWSLVETRITGTDASLAAARGLPRSQVIPDVWEGCAPCLGPYPREFREDVIPVVRNREPGARLRLKDVAADFGISGSCLINWLARPMSRTASSRERQRRRTPSCGRRRSAFGSSSRRNESRSAQHQGGANVTTHRVHPTCR